MEEVKRLAINMVAWNSLAYIPSFLASLEDQDVREFSLTIVDNASNDGTLAWLQNNRSDVTVLRNFRNQGFSRAHNQAISLAMSRWAQALMPLERCYVMVANPDLEFAPDAIRILLEQMDAQPEVAVFGPKILCAVAESRHEDGSTETRRTTVIDSTGLVIRKTRRVYDRGAGEEDQGQYDAARDIFGVSGACVIFRASALAEAMIDGEFFDEDFFAYKEDVDVAWRMRRLGFLARYIPEAKVWHHRRSPSAPTAGWLRAFQNRRARRRRSPWLNYLSTRNHGWVLLKNDDPVNIVLHAPWVLPYEAAKAAAALLSWSTLRGQVHSVFGALKMIRKRRAVAARVRVPAEELRRWFV